MKPRAAGRWREPANIFLAAALIGGVLFVLLTPPFQVPDEHTHFYRAYQVSEGGWLAERRGESSGGALPRSVADVNTHSEVMFHPERKLKASYIFDALSTPLAPQQRRFVAFENTTIIAPLPYLPQAAGIAIGRWLDLPPLALMYLGRLTNLLTWALLVYVAILTLPFYRRTLALLALLPMSLFQAASLSADAFTNGIAFLFSALVIRQLTTPTILRAPAAAAATLLALSKLVYGVLLLLCVAAPARHYGSAMEKWRHCAVCGGFAFLATVGWLYLARKVYVPIGWEPGVDPGAQLSFVLAAPGDYLMRVYRFYASNPQGWIESIVGRLGWLDTRLPFWFWNACWIVVVLTALCDGREDVVVNLPARLAAAVTVVLGVLAVTTAVYLSASRVGAAAIGGIQGRYFIPLLPTLMLLFYSQTLSRRARDRLPERARKTISTIIFPAWLATSIAFTLAVMLKRYYF